MVTSPCEVRKETASRPGVPCGATKFKPIEG